MEIKSVALMGAGAVGAYVISCLTGKGTEFYLIADGERAERLRKDGIYINHMCYKPEVKESNDVLTANGEGPDLLIIATKYMGLKESLPQIKACVGKNTHVLCILNGIDSEEILSEAIGAEHVIYSFMRIVSARVGNEITFVPETTDGIIYGEKDGSMSERVLAIDAFFHQYDLHHRLTDCILKEQWNKFALNIANNLVQTVIRVGYGAYFDSEHIGFVQKKVIEEVKAVAAAEGMEIEGIPTSRDAAPDAARFSTLQDIDAGRKTEIDMFLGVLLQKAKAHQMEIPFCEYTYHMIKALEEKNAGVFDYK